MQRSDYEQRRRAIEEQFQADVDLLRAGCEAKLRALELVWLMSAEKPLQAGETRRLSERVAAGGRVPDPVSETPRPEPPPPELPRRRGQVMDDLEVAFPNLPVVFDRRDIVRALGYRPPRTTLHRALEELLHARWAELSHPSDGHSPIRYRKLPPEDGEQG